MADVHPFRAYRYNARQVSPSQVVTQPYDKITPALQDHYYAASPYNLVRIILGRREQNDNPANNVYSRAAADFREWRKQGILRQDSLPSIYAYSQRFTVPGSSKEGSSKEGSSRESSSTTLERRGFIALGRIEDYSAGVVFRHEQTLAKPKADRLELLRATRAHFGQIFVVYEDDGQVEKLLLPSGNPDISVTDEAGVLHRVWQVSDPDVIRSVQTAMTDKKLIIADGHHRYETALTYRNERRAADSASSTQTSSPYEFVMMTFVNMNSPSLLILPTHRLVHSLPSFSEDTFRNSARAFFDVDEVDPSLDAARATAILRESGRCGASILAVTANRAFLLHHPNPNTPQVFAGLSLRQQALDVVQLHKYLLEKVLNLSEESIRNQQNLSYIRDAAEALSQVRGSSGARANVAFLINPCRMAQVRDIAFAGDVMPQKSTDFYPKLLSGLTVYALD
jgi:uncharacterized protein (DUF1015 family)